MSGKPRPERRRAKPGAAEEPTTPVRARDARRTAGDQRAERQPAPAPTVPSARLRWILLAVVLVVSTTVVVGAFNPAPHPGGDNAGYVTLAYSLVAHHSYTSLYDPTRHPHTKYPPVFPLLLAVLIALGARTWTALKTVAALSTIAAVGFSYLWAERRLGAARAAGVAAALAISSSVVFYSHWILSDPTFLMFTMASLWALDRADEEGGGARWLVLGAAAAGLAYFTRSAGVPLVLAILGWLALRRRWRALLFVAIGLGVPAALWWLRAELVGRIEYASEFWMVNPYDPTLGRVGIGGLLARVGGNLEGYVGSYLPGGVVGQGQGAARAALGIALVGLGLVGWVRRARRRIGAAELFLPLYAGVILLWPQVWSGDRFALPLLPVLFVYALQTLWDAAGRLGRPAAITAAVAALLVLVLPALGSWLGSVREASQCGSIVRADGPFACWGSGYEEFEEAAAWSASNLPAGSVVLTRKPRIFYVLSGLPSRTFPFETASAAHLALADSVGARYELLDQVGGLALQYVGSAIEHRPGAYCALAKFGQGSGVGTRLFGILPPDRRAPPDTAAQGGAVRIESCPSSYLRSSGGKAGYVPSVPSSRIPLLERLDP